ncbi:MAG: peptidase M15 [Betaproteobacteria bacterium]|nr:peptidase M15 [Betaproteobacteria bacterium]
MATNPSIAALCHSDTALARGIDNSPPHSLLPNLQRLQSGLAAIQNLLGSAISISSGYRCDELNRAVGGVPGSQHQEGLAADFECQGFGSPIEIALAIADSAIAFDQLIVEFGRWVHISFSPTPRRQMLTIYSSARGYQDGIVTEDGRRLA